MTNQKQQITLEEMVESKVDADNRNIDKILDDVQEVFGSNQAQANLISRMAVKLYHNSTDIDELNVQGMYVSAVVDALSVILVEEKKIISKQEMSDAVKKAYDMSIATIDEADELYSQMAVKASEGDNSEVTTV